MFYPKNISQKSSYLYKDTVNNKKFKIFRQAFKNSVALLKISLEYHQEIIYFKIINR